MIRADVITLIKEEPHGVFDSHTPKGRQVYAEIKSVRMSEFYKALNEGIEPTFVFTMTDYADYDDEKLCEYNGELYDIIRTYVKNQSIELTVRKHEVNS